MATTKNGLLICTILQCKTVEEMLSSMQRAKFEGADVVELRIDSISSFNISNIELLIKQKTLPVIVSFRCPIAIGMVASGGGGDVFLLSSNNPYCNSNGLKSSNGSYNGEEKKTCFQVLRLALQLDADFIELELEVVSEFLAREDLHRGSNSKFIVSCYVEGVTASKDELSLVVARLQSTGADIIKLVIHTTYITDVAQVFHLLSYCQVPLIVCALGDRGLISQLLCPKFGGSFIYGSVGGNPVPGLPSLVSLRKIYKVEHMNIDTKVFGLIANPVGHSKGPVLHNPALRHAGYNGIYVPMLVDDLKEFFKVYSCPDFAGFSVGIPHKEGAVECCDEVHPLAQSIGAVNTIIRRPSDGKLVGYNTDCEASITAIEDVMRAKENTNGKTSDTSPLAGRLFVLVGAGGAGRALAFGAKSRGARVVIFNRNYERAKALAFAVSGDALPYEDLNSFFPEKKMILANATSVGMQPNSDQSPIAKEALGAYELVFDAVYTPRNTRLLQDAAAAGAAVVSGVEMFIRQAIGQFNLFTGGEAPEEFMRTTVLTQF